jgi:outer membrane lipoprotein-sorting protein
MKYDKPSMQRSKVMTMVVVVAVATLLVAVTVTATQALAAKNLNSSKSNIYRQSTHQNQSIEGGSGQQVSSNTCICTSNDIIVINDRG